MLQCQRQVRRSCFGKELLINMSIFVKKLFTKTQSLNLPLAWQAQFLKWCLAGFGKELFMCTLCRLFLTYVLCKYCNLGALHAADIPLHVWCLNDVLYVCCREFLTWVLCAASLPAMWPGAGFDRAVSISCKEPGWDWSKLSSQER